MAYLISDQLKSRYAEEDAPEHRGRPELSAYSPAPPPAPEQPNTAAGPTLEGGNGRWINFSRYWNQNQNGANDMATGLGNDAENRAQDAQIRGQNALTNHASAVRAGSVKDEGAIAGSGGYQMHKGGGGTVSRQRAQELANGSYTGPTSLMDAQLDSTYGRAAMGIQNLQSVNGQQAELQEKAKGSYTQGASLLDAGLTQTAGGERFAGLKQRYSGLMNQLEGIKTQAGEASAKGAADSEANAHMYQDRLSAWEEAHRPADVADPNSPLAASAPTTGANDFRTIDTGGGSSITPPGWISPDDDGMLDDGSLGTTKSNDETLASQQGDAVLSAWEAAGKPSFDSWFSSVKSAWKSAGSPQPFSAWLSAYIASSGS